MQQHEFDLLLHMEQLTAANFPYFDGNPRNDLFQMQASGFFQAMLE